MWLFPSATTLDDNLCAVAGNAHQLLVRMRIFFLQAAVRFPPGSLSEITGVHIQSRLERRCWSLLND